MMNAQIDFTWQLALRAANILILQHTGRYLSDLEVTILQGAWHDRTYEQIAEAEGYTSGYLCRDVGCKLWSNLSTALHEKVSKKNFKAALQREWKNCIKSNSGAAIHSASSIEPQIEPGFAGLNSGFYVERSPIESICYETILKPGSLIWIKGAKWIGKTALIGRILERAARQGQKTVYLNFSSIQREVLHDPDKLWRWIYLATDRQLELQHQTKPSWHTNLDNRHSEYKHLWEQHILAQTNNIVLALDNIDRSFTSKRSSKQLLNSLADWYEKSKTSALWSKLKMVLSHSNKIPIPPQLDCPILNAGVPILLEEFSRSQIKLLAHLHQIDLDRFELARIMNEVGGHPYLASLMMRQIQANNAID